jgi:hypothetical protein
MKPVGLPLWLCAGLLVSCAGTAPQGGSPGTEPAAFTVGSTRLVLYSGPFGLALESDEGTGRARVALPLVQFDDGAAAGRLDTLEETAALGSVVTAAVSSAGGRRFTIRVDLGDPASVLVSITTESGRGRPAGGRRTMIELSFAGSGERCYGVQMYPEGGALDNRGRSFSLAGGRLAMKGGEWFSVRAPFFLMAADRAGRPPWGFWADTRKTAQFTFPVRGGALIRVNDALTDDPSTGPAGLAFRLFRAGEISGVLALFNRPEAGGPSRVPPDWALAPLWWRDDFHDDPRGVDPSVVRGGRVTDVGAAALADLDAFTRLRIPVGIVQFDRPSNVAGSRDEELPGYGTLVDGRLRPDMRNPAATMAELARRGVHALTWTSDRLVGDIKAEALKRGLAFADSPGAVDLSRPGAAEFWREILGPLVAEFGMSGYMMDRGEEDGIPALLAPGGGGVVKRTRDVPPRAVNAAAVEFPRVLNGILSEALGADFFLYGRNLFDRARRFAAAWNGDTRGWIGLEETIKHQLRAGLINFPVFGTDVGGYRHPLWGYHADPELYLRWLELAAFSTQMHLVLWPGCTPWLDFSLAELAVFQRYARLKSDLIPYAGSLVREAAATGMPPVRPLFLELGLEGRTADRWEEFFLGPDILIAPVTSKGQTVKDVELPPGLWLDFWDHGSILEGGRRITVAAPVDRIPAFVREGALIPTGDILKLNDGWTPDWEPHLTILAFPSPARSRSCVYRMSSGEVPLELRVEAQDVIFSAGPTGMRTELRVTCARPSSMAVNGEEIPVSDWAYDDLRQELSVSLDGRIRNDVVLRSAKRR